MNHGLNAEIHTIKFSLRVACWELLSRSFSEVVVVCIDTATELSSLKQTLAANLIILIVGNVELEEASVGLREALVVHASHQANLMLP